MAERTGSFRKGVCSLVNQSGMVQTRIMEENGSTEFKSMAISSRRSSRIRKLGWRGYGRTAMLVRTARAVVMPSRTDQYFPPEDSEIETKYLRIGEFAPIETIWEHIGGVEVVRMKLILSGWMGG